MSIRSNTPCDYDGFCPYAAEFSCSCEYWCGAEEPEDYPEDEDFEDFEIEDTRWDVVGVRKDGYIKSYAENLDWNSANRCLDNGSVAYFPGPEGNLDTWALEIVEHIR